MVTVPEDVIPKSTVLLCIFMGNRTAYKGYHKEMFPDYCGKCLSRKAVHNWAKKFSQGRSKVADDSRPGQPVEIVTEATMQLVEELSRADRMIKTV
jgi:hypothetical protein